MYDAPFITANELANALNLPVSWIKAEAQAGRLPCIRAGRRLMFDPALVRASLAERSRGGNLLIVVVDPDGYRIVTADDLREGPSDA